MSRRSGFNFEDVDICVMATICIYAVAIFVVLREKQNRGTQKRDSELSLKQSACKILPVDFIKYFDRIQSQD